MCASFALVGALTVTLNLAAFAALDGIRVFLRVPEEVWPLMREYLAVIFWGIVATFLYNYFASFLRSVGNSVIPLVFLGVSAAMNIALDLWFVLGLKRGVAGAAEATVIAQYLSGLGIAAYTMLWAKPWRGLRGRLKLHWHRVREIGGFSVLTCVQQSVMNLGILMVQGLVNSFGPTVMAAFAAAVKIDAFAYMPVQDFGNAFSTFIAQNYGAREKERIEKGLKGAVVTAIGFSMAVSVLVWVFAGPLMGLFTEPGERAIVVEGVRYLRIEGGFYAGIGCLFLLYGLYRALGKPGMSVVLTVAEQDYVEVARSYGASNARIIFRYVLPNAMGPIIVNTTMAISDMILSAAGLSFIGMGIQPPSPEWGALLSAAQTYIFTSPYLLVFPGLFIILSSLSFNLVGDGLTDALDPKLKD